MKISIPKKAYLNVLIVIVIAIFSVSLFKHISYPLLWNDESYGAMCADRILQYGYPKVHDGKNIVFEPNKFAPWTIGYNQKYDAPMLYSWGNEYFAVIGVLLSKYTNDLYFRTALVRLPFAIIGFLGVILFIALLSKFVSNKIHYKFIIILFFIFELLSVPLVLHIREARYYSLVIFITACFLNIFLSHYYFTNKKYNNYIFLLLAILFISYNINFIVCFIISLTVLVFWIIRSLKNIIWSFLQNKNTVSIYFIKSELKILFKMLLPLFVNILLIAPIAILFDTITNSMLISKYYRYDFNNFLHNLEKIWIFFKDYDFLYTAIIVKTTVIILWLFHKINEKQLSQKNSDTITIRLLLNLSTFLISFIFIYSICVARTPIYFFTRYFIVLQPILTLMILVDMYLVYMFIHNGLFSGEAKKILKISSFVFLSAIVTFNSLNKIPMIKDHIYELSHQYKGPLDFIIPYINTKVSDTEKLIIATNYESSSYMFYLQSKVIIGYVPINLEDDMKHQPDIIIFRQSMDTSPEVLKSMRYFASRVPYRYISFPVFDTPHNNIPELSKDDYLVRSFIVHRFKTLTTLDEKFKVAMYIRADKFPVD